jgi:hypothetical protein
LSSSSSSGLPDHVSNAFAPEHPAQYPAGYPRRPHEGRDHPVPVSCCVSAAGVCFLVILFPLGSWAFLAVGSPDRDPDPGRVTAFRTHKMRPGRAPSIAHGRWCSSRQTTITGLHLAYLNAVSLHRATTPINSRLRMTSHRRGFKQFARPIFRSPVASGWIASSPAFLGLRTPRLLAAHAEDGDGSN